MTPTVYATPLMTPTTALGLSICLSMFELRETGDWDIFPGTEDSGAPKNGRGRRLVELTNGRFFLFLFWKTQANHWTKRMLNTQLIT